MRKFSRLAFPTAVTVGLSLGATGCSSSDDDDVIVVPTATGTLTSSWSIDGTVTPSSCRVFGAFDFELAIYDGGGAYHSQTHAPCENFTLTIELPIGLYSADVTLVDPDDFAVSTTQEEDDTSILQGTDLVVPVDFPAESMLTSAQASGE